MPVNVGGIGVANYILESGRFCQPFSSITLGPTVFSDKTCQQERLLKVIDHFYDYPGDNGLRLLVNY